MSAVLSISTGKICGVSRVCRVRGPSRASVYRDLQPAQAEPSPRRRPEPQGPLSDADLAREIRPVITDSRFHGEGYRKVWARLRYKGIGTSQARVLRLMRENGLCAKPCRGPAHGPVPMTGPSSRTVSTKGQGMWGTDTTARACGNASGRSARMVAAGLTIRHDNGSQYISHDFQNEIAWLGATSSPSLSAPPKGTAVPSASSGRSRKICSGSEPLGQSRNCRRPSRSSRTITTSIG